MEEVLGKIFEEVASEMVFTSDRGALLVYHGEDEDGEIYAIHDENDDGEPILHLENVVSYRRGYGTELMHRLEEAAREAGYTAIEGTVFPLNDRPQWWDYHRLLGWYKFLGYEYMTPEDEEAARFILAQPGEDEIARFPEEIRKPKIRKEVKE